MGRRVPNTDQRGLEDARDGRIDPGRSSERADCIEERPTGCGDTENAECFSACRDVEHRWGADAGGDVIGVDDNLDHSSPQVVVEPHDRDADRSGRVSRR